MADIDTSSSRILDDYLESMICFMCHKDLSNWPHFKLSGLDFEFLGEIEHSDILYFCHIDCIREYINDYEKFNGPIL